MPNFGNYPIKIWKLLLRRIRDQYRLVILNEETLEERISFKLSRLNVFVAIGLLSIILVFITTYIIAFTPLKEYIPGYTDVTLQRRIYELQLRNNSGDLLHSYWPTQPHESGIPAGPATSLVVRVRAWTALPESGGEDGVWSTSASILVLP